MASSFKCPSCRRPLSVGINNTKPESVYLWCGYGPCHPAELGDGFAGLTLADAYSELVEKYQEWLKAQRE